MLGNYFVKQAILSVVYIFALALPLFAQPTGSVELKTFFSPVLQTTKAYTIYLPPGYDESARRYPVVYFLRLHESEWFDHQLSGRDGSALQEVVDSLIESGEIGEMILVGPNTGSDDGSIAGMMNMRRPDLTDAPGIGTGQFEDYFVKDLIPEIEANYKILPGSAFRGIDGFSFGGYTALVLAFRNPGLFSSVGSYDGTFMFYNLNDPELSNGDHDDPFWLDEKYDGLVGPLFGIPRDIEYMLDHSAVNILLEADDSTLDELRTIRFHLHTGLSAIWTNVKRNRQLVDSMAVKGLVNSFSLTLSINAVHDYGFADLHARKSLIEHWKTFQLDVSVQSETAPDHIGTTLYSNYPNPFNSSTSIRYDLEHPGWVEVSIYSLLGARVKVLYQGVQQKGSHQVIWDGRDEGAMNVSRGLYIYTLKTSSSYHTGKMIRM